MPRLFFIEKAGFFYCRVRVYFFAKLQYNKTLNQARQRRFMKERHITIDEIKEGAPFAAISYIFFLWILTFMYRKDNQFAKYHAKQGIVIFVGELMCIFLSLIPAIGRFFYLCGLLILFPILCLYGIYTALMGKTERIPVVSDIADKFVI